MLHTKIGRRWLKPALGDNQAILARAQRVGERPTPNLDSARQSTPKEDWWPRLVREALGKDSTSEAGRVTGGEVRFVHGSGSG